MGSVRLYGATSGYLELQAPDVAPDSTLVLPSDSVQPGLVHVHTESFSAQSTVSIDDVFTSTYANYKVMWQITAASTDSIALTLRWRASGTDNTDSEYNTCNIGISTGGIASNLLDGSATSHKFAEVGTSIATINSASFDVQSPQLAQVTHAHGAITWFPGTGTADGANIAAHYFGSDVFDGFSLIASTGTITGTLRIYGYRNN
jgi:hypothetical protein